MHADGQTPLDVTLAYQGSASGVPYDGTSPLFGATSGDRTEKDFRIDLPADIVAEEMDRNESSTNSARSVANCADGATPYSSPMIDGSGNLFGTTTGGRRFPDRARSTSSCRRGKHYAQTVLYSFCAVAGCDDGTSPFCHAGDGRQGQSLRNHIGGWGGRGKPGPGHRL